MNYLDIGVEEEANTVIGMSIIKKANSDMLATYSLAQMRIKASTDIIH